MSDHLAEASVADSGPSGSETDTHPLKRTLWLSVFHRKFLRVTEFRFQLVFLFLAACTLSIFASLDKESPQSSWDRLLRQNPAVSTKKVVYLQNIAWSVAGFELKHGFSSGLLRIGMSANPDFGGLEFLSMHNMPQGNFSRHIDSDDGQQYEESRYWLLKTINAKRVKTKYQKLEDRDPAGCFPPKWKYDIYPNCNAFHEFALEVLPERPEQDFDIKYLAKGHYRESYLFEPLRRQDHQKRTRPNKASGVSSFVLKHLRFNFDFDEYDVHSIHNEALVFEMLSGSPRTSDIYGFCATSMLVEKANEITYHIVPELSSQESRGRMAQSELDKLEKKDVHPMNDLSVLEKLSIAIVMAEALAEMHGARGVITHDDVHPDQWLATDEGHVILNDVNNAVVLDWHFDEKKYCKYGASYGGDFRAPEEFRGDAYVDESVDVWPMGNIIFSLLTGLWPYYGETNRKLNRKKAMKGIAPYLDPRYENRSMIEGRLVAIMKRCHVLDPTKRADIFEVVRHLRETLRLHQGDAKQEHHRGSSRFILTES